MSETSGRVKHYQLILLIHEADALKAYGRLRNEAAVHHWLDDKEDRDLSAV
jgi:hypothetical protein